MLRLNPELWRELGDATTWTRNQAMSEIKLGTAQHECVKEGVERMRQSLLADGSSGLEVIAIEQILTNYIQTGTTGYRLESLDPGELTAEQARFWESRHHHAQTRLLMSMAVLARLRKNRVDIFVTRNRNHAFEPSANSNLDHASIR